VPETPLVQPRAPAAAEQSPPPGASRARRARVLLLWSCVRAVDGLLRALPFLGAPVLGAALGRLVHALAVPLRRTPREQLELCYGAQLTTRQKRSILRGMFAHFGRCVFELLAMARMDRAGVERAVRVEGLEHLEAARAAGRGILIVTGHVGNWELMAAWVAGRVPLTVLARGLPNWKLDEWLVALRARHGVRTVYRGTLSAVREALRALRRGDAVGILIDQDTRVDGCFVPFFGRPAFTPTGAAALALRTGAVLLPAFIHREEGGHRLGFEPPVEVPSGLGRAERESVVTGALTARIERAVRRRPEQWVWVHRRFKTCPPGGEAG
jgi:Kdo2-lipid IVA lauroyltransferase/acyltransferase